MHFNGIARRYGRTQISLWRTVIKETTAPNINRHKLHSLKGISCRSVEHRSSHRKVLNASSMARTTRGKKALNLRCISSPSLRLFLNYGRDTTGTPHQIGIYRSWTSPIEERLSEYSECPSLALALCRHCRPCQRYTFCSSRWHHHDVTTRHRCTLSRNGDVVHLASE